MAGHNDDKMHWRWRDFQWPNSIKNHRRTEKILPTAGSIANPVDVLGDADGELYGKAIDLLLRCESVDSLIVILTPQKMTDDRGTAQAVVDISRKYNKPVFACFMGADIIIEGLKICVKTGSLNMGSERTAAT